MGEQAESNSTIKSSTGKYSIRLMKIHLLYDITINQKSDKKFRCSKVCARRLPHNLLKQTGGQVVAPAKLPIQNLIKIYGIVRAIPPSIKGFEERWG